MNWGRKKIKKGSKKLEFYAYLSMQINNMLKLYFQKLLFFENPDYICNSKFKKNALI